MFARNSDLYFDVSASSAAFSSSARRACSISGVLALDLDVLFRELLRLLRELFVGLLQLVLLRLQFAGELLRLLAGAPSVCIVASIVLSTMPMLAVS